LKIWKDSYKTPRSGVSIQKIKQNSKTVLLTFISEYKEIGVITICVSCAEYQKAGYPSFNGNNEIRVFTEGKAARKACDIAEEALPIIMLGPAALLDVPITALRVVIDHWNDKNEHIQLIGSVTSWSIRKINFFFLLLRVIKNVYLAICVERKWI